MKGISMTRRVALLAALTLIATNSAPPQAGLPAPIPQKPKLDATLEQLQGTWTLLAYSVDGRLLRGEDARTTFTVEDDRWTSSWPKDGGVQLEQGKVRIVEAAGQQKVMDLIHDRGPYKGTTTRALYQVEGDSLRYSSMVAPESVRDSRVVTTTMTWKRKRR